MADAEIPHVAVGQVREGVAAPLTPLQDLLNAHIDSLEKEQDRLRSASVWTADTLKISLDAVLVEREKRYGERSASQDRAVVVALAAQQAALDAALEAQQKAFSSTFVAQKEAVAAALTAQKEAVSAALAAADRAVQKAEASSEKQFSGVNEFRSALSDQQRTLIPRAEAEVRFTSLEEKIAALTIISSERRGAQRGSADLGSWVVSGVMALIAVASIVVAVITHQ